MARHGQLTLVMLLELDAATGNTALKELLFQARELGLDLRYDTVGSLRAPSPTPRHRYAITAMADQIGPRPVQVLAEPLAKQGANIAAIERLSEGGLTAIEVRAEVDEAHDRMGSLRHALQKVAIAEGVDLVIQREGLTRRSTRLVVFDMDSTLIQRGGHRRAGSRSWRWRAGLSEHRGSDGGLTPGLEHALVDRQVVCTSTPYPSSPHAIADHPAFQRILAVADFL